MQQHSLPLVAGQHGAGLEIDQQVGEEEGEVLGPKDHHTPAHSRQAVVQIAANVGFGDALREDRWAVAEEERDKSVRLQPNRIDFTEGEPYDKPVHPQDREVLQDLIWIGELQQKQNDVMAVF